ncbi:hypothetical protein SASPL_154356 [Salvia splendens]|uniref:non-specific serine/threonine protein kinase n=1 Tax=Salvia splendens TaxID=180675 RepID=A0A8X8VZY7_SALSN|nr:hypothetical protein SASPL_154356 [Salvia splendens]
MTKSELGSGSRKRKALVVALPVVLGLSLLLYSHTRKKRNHEQQEKMDTQHPSDSHEELELPMYDLSTIIKATDDFSVNNKLGEGGFGPVYKHRNLVRLLGCCIQGEERILLYEYMTNNSLDLILFDKVMKKMLDWPRCFNIINGIAQGLMYLHQDSRLRVIHRDLKTSNILLDSDMNPKISDFGLARTFGGNETGANTSRVVGTYGYMSPEYAVDGMFSVKSNVFSFGVLVLEIISGMRNRGFTQKNHRYNLLGHVVRSIHVGFLCVQEQTEERPNMSSVVLMLNNDGVLPESKQPSFFTGRDIKPNETSHSSNTASSVNAITISLLEAR